MATPPFNPDETLPADDDFVSQFPTVERAFRDIIEAWISVDHDTNGEHAQVTLPERGSDPTNASNTGFLYTKDDGGDTELYYEDDGGAVVQLTADGAINATPSIPSGTVTIFYQSAAPTGWTKTTGATLDDHAIRIVTSTTWAGGSNGTVAFSTCFARTATDGHTLTSAESGMPAHAHTVQVGVGSGEDGGVYARRNDTFNGSVPIANNATALNASSAHSHNMDIRVKYANFILATKD